MSEKKNQAVKAVSLMMMITLVGKILGLVREQFLAANYAGSMEAAAFLTASRIPRTFFDAVFAAAITASFIPIFNEYLQQKGKEAAFVLANRFITMVSVATVVVMVIGSVAAEPMVRLFATGYEAETVRLAVPMFRMLLPTVLFTAIAFSFVGILQSLDEFNIPAALSVASNAVIIVYYIFFNERFGIQGLTLAFLIGWGMQAVMQLPSLHQKGYRYRPDFHFKDEGLKKIGKFMLPVMVSTWIQPINFMINSRYASQLPNGEFSVATFDYANSLYTIIVGVFVLAIANLIFPKLSRISGEENKEEFSATVGTTLRSMLFFLIPMMVGLMVLCKPLVQLMFQRGAFDGAATASTATALFFFATGMVGYGIQTILSRVFYANQNGKMPFYSGVVSILVNAMLCKVLLVPMGIGGIALASAVSASVAALMLFIPTVRKYPRMVDKALVASLWKMCIAAGGMFFLVFGSYKILRPLLGEGFVGLVLLLGLPTAIGVVAYMLFAFLLGVEEGQMVFSFLGKLCKRGQHKQGGTPEKQTDRRKRRKGMGIISILALHIEDSFCFRVLSKIMTFFVRLWNHSVTAHLYHRICKAVGRGFHQSAVFGFLRSNWDSTIAPWQGIFPRTWHRLIVACGRGVSRGTSYVGSAFAQSFIFKICNQNFLILCLCAIVFAIPILPTMLLALLCAGTLGVYIVNLCMGRIRVQRTSLMSIFLGLFALCIIYGSVTSYAFPRSLQVMAVFLLFLSMFFVAKDCIDTEEKLDFVLMVMITMGALIALFAIYQYIVGVEMDEAWVDAESFTIRTRAYATFNNPNVLGEYLILMGSLAAGMLWKVRNWFGKVFYVGCFGVICLGLVATNSRGAMLGLLFSAGLFVLLAERRLIPLGIAGLLSMPFVLPQELWARLLSSVTMADSSSRYRLSIYEAGQEMVNHYWTTGIGVDAFNQIYPIFSFEAANAYHVHNLFLQELIELGFLGFGVLLLMMVFFFQKTYSAIGRTPRRFGVLLGACFGGFAGLLLQGMTDHIWFDYSIILLFWVFLGIAMAVVRVGEKAWQREK